MRKLDDRFMKDLQEGELSKFLELVKSDNTLDLEIRENYINIYYRGGNIDKISRNESGKYIHDFDENYFKTEEKFEVTIDKFPIMKQAMNSYLKDKAEREFQQLIVRENNYSKIAKSTDYYIADIEYMDSANKARSDIVAVKWESDSPIRKKTAGLELALIEVKYGDGALSDESGMLDHLEKANNINIYELQNEMRNCFNQKIELGLIPDLKKIENFKEQSKIDFIFLLINHDPAKSDLKTELDKIDEAKNYKNLNIKFVVSNFMGYGLYKECIYTLEEFKKLFKKQIYCKD
jgi:hypothetical protein